MVLKDGKWAGRRAFIIGGGPSLKHFDFSLLSGELCIGVNMAFLHGPCVNLVLDHTLIQSLSGDPRWKNYRGVKVWVNGEAPAERGLFPGVLELTPCRDHNEMPRWSYSLSSGLWFGTNAGASALNLADVLGASPIYLLGFDMTGAAGKTKNWHDEYPEKQDEIVYKNFSIDFIRNVPNIRGKVINLNPASNLKCFEFGRIEDVFQQSANHAPKDGGRHPSGRPEALSVADADVLAEAPGQSRDRERRP